jgi:ABC-type branched-subunit amino acid transport system substrate-binding protein
MGEAPHDRRIGRRGLGQVLSGSAGLCAGPKQNPMDRKSSKSKKINTINLEESMFVRLKRRGFLASLAATAAFALLPAASQAQTPSGEPVKIGFSMSLTGPLAANGKQALLGMQIWEEEINAKGGLLGRPVKLIYYDDQSQAAPVPGIYTKLLDIDKVDLIIGPYATVPAAAAMTVAVQRKKVFEILFGLDVNAEFKYDRFFSMIPTGPDTKPSFTDGFFQTAMAQNPKPQTVALAFADAEFGVNACEGARSNAKKAGLKIVYDKSYPPATADFSPIVRAVQASNPDLFVICSYPLDSVGMVKAVNEVGFKPKMIGGAMVGLQATVFKNQLGPLLNGWVNYETWVPRPRASIRSATTWEPGATPTSRFTATRSTPQRVSTTASSRTTCTKPPSRPSWAISSSARMANGRKAACCRCSITASNRVPGSIPGVA